MSGASLPLRLAPDVTAAAAGDARAFERLVDATRNTVASIAMAIVRDVELSHDVAQEVYLAVWRDLGRLRDPSSFLPWLRQITRNRSRHALRTRTRRERRMTTGDMDQLLAAAADPRPDAVARMVAAEERRALEDAVAALPDGTREVVILYYREGESTRQVAELLELNEAAVRQRLSRARGQLRQRLAADLRATAPGVAFTAGVLTALSLAAPGAAAAATVVGAGAASKTGAPAAAGLGGGLLKLAALPLAGPLLGLLGGTFGVLFGARKLWVVARDERERRGVLATSAALWLITAAFLAAMVLRPDPLTATVGYLAMVAVFWAVHYRWLPSVTAPRKAAEEAEDPEGFRRREARERLHGRWGFAVGTGLGGLAVLASWFF